MRFSYTMQEGLIWRVTKPMELDATLLSSSITGPSKKQQRGIALHYIYPFAPVFKNILWKFIVPAKTKNGHFLKN